MDTESALLSTTSSLSARGGGLQALGPPGYAHHTAGPLVSSAEQVSQLVRRAMSFFESDREVAWRCLQDASVLLDSETPETHRSVWATPGRFHTGGLARWQAKRALAYIEANLGSKINTRQLAGLVSFSKGHFSRAFKRSLGLPPMAYVVSRRVERAKFMMATTREQLTAIALACGFADQSHLNRSFRRMMGVSPGLWRRTAPETLHGGVETGEPRS